MAKSTYYWCALGVEFCGGLIAGPATGLDADQLLASFGVNDGEAFLAVLAADGVRSRLQVVRQPGIHR